MTEHDLVTRLLPVLGRSLNPEFNVFDVMHHGTHEKQLSNVFRWLLDIGGTHHFGGLGQQLFVELLDAGRADRPALPSGPYSVRQEVSTSAPEDAADIADIVLENESAVIVIENFETSNGHGHGYDRYLQFARRDGKAGVVVLLCITEDSALQTRAWEGASVMTYDAFIDRLVERLDHDPQYGRQNQEQRDFIGQLHRKYVRRAGRVDDTDVLEFVTTMCRTGDAKRYRELNQDVAAERFANDLAQQARESFGEGREVLQRVKARLRSHGAGVVAQQLNESLGEGYITQVTARFSGIYQWTVNFETSEEQYSFGEARLQIKFGPTAWFANEEDPNWTRRVPSAAADYSRLFLTRARNHEIRQSAVSLQEVLAGLPADDRRLHDELLELIGVPGAQ